MPEACLPKSGWSFKLTINLRVKIVLKCKVVLKAFYSFAQNRDVNQGSRCDIIGIGTP